DAFHAGRVEQMLRAAVRRHPLVRRGTAACDHAVHDRLHPDHDRHAADQEGADVERDAVPQRQLPRQQRGDQRHPGDHQHRARIAERPARRMQHQEAQVPPAVAPGAQVRRAAAPVLGQHRRHLADVEMRERGGHDHLAGEFHACRAQVEVDDRLAIEPAQPAVKIADRDAEEQPPDRRQHGIAEIAMQQRHRAGQDAALEPVAHHQLSAIAQCRDKGGKVAEVGAVVGIAHDDVAPARGVDAAAQCPALARDRRMNDARARRLRDRDRPVGTAVVGHQHLARDAGTFEIANRLADAGRNRLGFVEARDQDRELDRGRGAVHRVRPSALLCQSLHRLPPCRLEAGLDP
ncbi:hypothetical protein LTR94_026128, partial [Friedmanniomyces endolithicus]